MSGLHRTAATHKVLCKFWSHVLVHREGKACSWRERNIVFKSISHLQTFVAVGGGSNRCGDGKVAIFKVDAWTPQVRTCTSRVLFCRNSFPQLGQESGMRPCLRSWLTSSNLRKNPAPQSEQTKGLVPPWNLECIMKCSSLENDSPQICKIEALEESGKDRAQIRN